jgi:hypothetical protein
VLLADQLSRQLDGSFVVRRTAGDYSPIRSTVKRGRQNLDRANGAVPTPLPFESLLLLPGAAWPTRSRAPLL